MISLDGFALNQATREGLWRITELTGWWDPPQTRADDIERPFGDGEIPGTITYQSRRIRISGRVISKSHGYMHEAMQRLAGLSFRKFSTLVVDGHGSTQSATVRVDGQVTFVPRTDKYLQFEIPLLAVDPFKYGSSEAFSVASGSSSDVHHMGTVDSWPVVTVTGSMPDGYSLSYRSQSVSVPMGLPSGVTHRIDFKNRRLYVNGDVFFGAFGSTGFRPVPAGHRTTFGLTCPSGSGTAVVSVTDTFI